MVNVNGVRLHVAACGPEGGDPIVLVHGWPQNWWCWRHVASSLAGSHRCLMPDLRGMGRSEAPAQGYEKETLADDLLGVLDRFGLSSVRYVGHDWGGWIGLLLGMRAPDRISSLVALSIPHPWPSWHDRLNPWRLSAFGYQLPLSTPGIGERLMRSGLTRKILRRTAPPGTYAERDLEMFDGPMRSADGARATVTLYRTFLLRELPRIVAGRYRSSRLPVPTKLVVGDRDLVVRGADLAGFEDHAPRMTVERVPEAGHFLPEEAPELVIERVLDGHTDSQ